MQEADNECKDLKRLFSETLLPFVLNKQVVQKIKHR